LPFKLNQGRRHHISRQNRKVVNWRDYNASLRQRGILTMWFIAEMIEGWRVEPRTTGGAQAWYSPLAILTVLTSHAVFHLTLRQTEGLIGSIVLLLVMTLSMPDHSTLSRRAATLAMPPPRPSCVGDGVPNAASMHLLVGSTGLKLCGVGEWLIERHGTHAQRSWRKLHIGVNAETGQIAAAALTAKDIDDTAQVSPLARWNSDAQSPSASPDPGWGWGRHACTPDVRNTLAAKA